MRPRDLQIMAIKRKAFQLTNDNIDIISENVLDEMNAGDISAENRIRTRLSVETALLRMQEHFGDRITITVSSYQRFGRHYIDVRHRGDAYNPLRHTKNDYEEWNRILSYDDYQPDYQYSGHNNLIRWSVPVQKKHPAIVSGKTHSSQYRDIIQSGTADAYLAVCADGKADITVKRLVSAGPYWSTVAF